MKALSNVSARTDRRAGIIRRTGIVRDSLVSVRRLAWRRLTSTVVLATLALLTSLAPAAEAARRRP